MEWGRFNKDTIDKLARRAGFRCSNPGCGALTSGPQEGSEGAVNLGEAAHIYGARPGSARFDEVLSAATRSDITNGVWLCRNCHKRIDNDQQHYTSELLFRWRRDHEALISRQLGKAGDLARYELTAEKYKPFLERSSLAYQIATEKPDFWEYKLTVALLQEQIANTNREYIDLSEGFASRPYSVLNPDDFPLWASSKLGELSAIISALAKTIDNRFALAWSAPGEPGDEWEILRACELVVQSCRNLLQWEESVRSTKTASEFDEVLEYLAGTGGRLIERVNDIPIRLSQLLQQEGLSGTVDIKIEFDVPEGFSDEYTRRYERALKRYYGANDSNEASRKTGNGRFAVIVWISLFLLIVLLFF